MGPRVVAICVFHREGRILAKRCTDPATGEAFLRPVGGGVAFGELGAEAVAREVREELGEEVAGVRLLGVLENRFTYGGQPGHEVVLVYDARFARPEPYGQPALPVRDDHGAGGEAVWVALDGRGPGAPPLYPAGLSALLRRRGFPDA